MAKGADGGVDILAHKDELGFEPPIIKVQVKSKEGTSGDPEVSSLYGKCDKDEYALFVTLGDFSNQAISFARSKPNLRLVAGDELVNIILQHYEQFDSRYKGLLPLKRVYVPDPEDTEE
ncbi:putative Mrr-cat superfamily restriction endonuclease [Bradyrhizobium sp. i1.8.4]|uniref:restriction endonuclease n=1 Tax=unclassified Bradyrhizobium TaxID=2631580 RepID=UPI003D1F2DE5